MHVCSSCHRHVREARCPFCGIESSTLKPVAGASAMYVGMRRAAVLAGALVVTGCSTDGKADASAPDGIDQEVVSVDALYGVPADAFPTPQDAAADTHAAPDVDSIDSAYGIPPWWDVVPQDATSNDH